MPALVRQLFDPASSTYTYLVADPEARVAALIDPVFETAERDAALLDELGLRLLLTLETHVHADHVTGAWRHHERTKSEIAVAAAAGASGATRALRPGDVVDVGAHRLEVRATPGHTEGCLSYVLDGGAAVFTGDALLVRGCGRTDFQGGDAHALFRSVREQLFTLPPTCVVWPGHDYRGVTVTTIGEERAHNPRLGDAVREDDFVLYVASLELPRPKQMDHAVPANLRCGRPEEGTTRTTPSWATLTRTFAGHLAITPEALEEARGAVTIVDVREPAELEGELGRVEGAVNVPLATLTARATELPPGPLVTVCHSGARSVQATVLLARAGRSDVASLAGGIVRWRAEGHTTVGGRE